MPTHGTLRRSSKHNSIQSHSANRSNPNKVIGKTETTEEIWIDGIEHLEKAATVNQIANNARKNEFSSSFHTSLPFVYQNNNNIKHQNTNDPHKKSSAQFEKHTIGKYGTYVESDDKITI